MTFRVGQKVVCVDDAHLGLRAGEIGPVVGQVYTVRSFHNDRSRSGIRLSEIKNPILAYHPKPTECAFLIRRFRPLVERNTDISSLVALLNPNNHKLLPEDIKKVSA